MLRATGQRHRSQAGTTLVELVVSLLIASLALALVVGTISSGLLNSTLAKRNTAVQAVLQYEIDSIAAESFSASAATYSDCFAIDAPTSPARLDELGDPCPSGTYSLRADVSWSWLPGSSTVQVWTVAVVGLPSGGSIGAPVSVYKAAR